MKIFVTGAAGFIGHAVLRELLERGFEVVAFVRHPYDISFGHDRLEWRLGDMTDRESVRAALRGCDAVIHAAGAKSDERDSHQINAGGAANLVQEAEAAGIKGIINISTISTKLKKKGRYAMTKAAADQFFMAGKVPSVTLRLSVVYGGNGEGIFGSITKALKLPFVPVFGDGRFTSRPIHVGDAAKAIVRVVSRPMSGHQVYDLGGEEDVAFDEIVNMISMRLRGHRARIVHIPVIAGLAAAHTFRIFLRNPPLTVSNVLAMYQKAPVLPQEFFIKYDFHPRPLNEGLASLTILKDPQRQEAEALIGYMIAPFFSGRKPRNLDALIEIYVRALRLHRLDGLPLNPRISNSRLLIGGLDAATSLFGGRGTFRRKIFIASAVVECSTISSHWLLPRDRGLTAAIAIVSVMIVRSAGKIMVGTIMAIIPGLLKRHA